VFYCCNGAVGGAGGGSYHEFAPGDGMVDPYDDGSFDNQYVVYGWVAKQ
jgi:hypothetical protein